MVGRCVKDYHGDINFGTVHAVEGGSLSEVISDVMRQISPHSPITWVPRNATLWQDVAHLRMPREPELYSDLLIDLRYGPWEKFQTARVFPLMHSGEIVDNILVPIDLTPQETQMRITNVIQDYEVVQLIIPGGESWLANKTYLSEHIIGMLEDNEERRLSRLDHGQRYIKMCA